MRMRVFIILPQTYGDFFSEFKKWCGKSVLLVKSMHGMTLSGKYRYGKFNDRLISMGFQYFLPALYYSSERKRIPH
jgi:hypothetical protein